MPAATAAIVIAADWLLVAACYPALRLGNRARGLVLALASACVMASPLLLPPASTGLRMIVATGAVWLMCQLYDLHLGARRGTRPDLRTFLRYLPNPAWLVCRKPPPRTTTRAEDWAAVARGTMGFAVTVPIAWLAFTWHWH